ncbi:hypothetical protein [Streptosporangium sp. NPDC003464]
MEGPEHRLRLVGNVGRKSAAGRAELHRLLDDVRSTRESPKRALTIEVAKVGDHFPERGHFPEHGHFPERQEVDALSAQDDPAGP